MIMHGAARRSPAEIITDRNLYRPGQTVKMKGLVRDVTQFSGLMIPFGAGVHWSITEADGSRVVGEGDTTLSPYGGWEGEWSVPEKAKLGSYEIRCSVAGRDFEGVTLVGVQEYRVPLFSVIVEATSPEVGTTAHARISSAYFHGAPNAGATRALESDVDDFAGVRQRDRRGLSETFQHLCRGRSEP